jgi:hypothetical protein
MRFSKRMLSWILACALISIALCGSLISQNEPPKTTSRSPRTRLPFATTNFAEAPLAPSAPTKPARDQVIPSVLSLRPGEEFVVVKEEDAIEDSCITVATIPRPLYRDGTMPELSTIQRTAVTSWIDGGVSEVLYLVGNDTGENYDVSKLGLLRNIAPFVRTVSGLENDRQFSSLPLVSSAFKLADRSASCKVHVVRGVFFFVLLRLVEQYVGFMNTDIIVLPSFEATLSSILKTVRDVSTFLLVGHRLRIRGDAAEIEKTVLEGETAMWKSWVEHAADPSAHAMDLFVWRKGTMQDVPIPNFLIG